MQTMVHRCNNVWIDKDQFIGEITILVTAGNFRCYVSVTINVDISVIQVNLRLEKSDYAAIGVRREFITCM